MRTFQNPAQRVSLTYFDRSRSKHFNFDKDPEHTKDFASHNIEIVLNFKNNEEFNYIGSRFKHSHNKDHLRLKIPYPDSISSHGERGSM